MDFNVKGITFKKEDLTVQSLSELKAETISRSHLFHLLPGDRKAILLLRAGDYVETSFINKYLDKGVTSLYQLEVTTQEEIDFYKAEWSKLKSARSQNEQLMIRDQIIAQIANDFWSSKEKSFLSFVISCFEEFYIFPPHILEKYQELSMTLYTRSLLMSATSGVVSLCNGFTDYHFIKDFYNTSFITDFGLIEFGKFQYMLSRACEVERQTPGAGVNFLKEKNRPNSEVQVFIHHPNTSYRAAKEFAKEFSNPEVLNFIKLHHEKSDGTGFPKGYRYSCMSQAETLLVFCDYLIPFSEHLFSRGDGHLILNEYFEILKKIENKELLPIQKIISSWEKIMSWAVEKMEVAS